MAKRKKSKKVVKKKSNKLDVAKTTAEVLIAGAAVGAAAYALKDKKTRKKLEKELKNVKKLGEDEITKFTNKLEKAAEKSQKKLDTKLEKEMEG